MIVSQRPETQATRDQETSSKVGNIDERHR